MDPAVLSDGAFKKDHRQLPPYRNRGYKIAVVTSYDHLDLSRSSKPEKNTDLASIQNP
jgi:hypothetical protein